MLYIYLAYLKILLVMQFIINVWNRRQWSKILMYLLAVNKYILSVLCDQSISKLFTHIIEQQNFTEAKFSKDSVTNPQKLKVKTLPFCNKNNINFCMSKGAKYHGMLYLQKNNIVLIIYNKNNYKKLIN